MQKCISCLPEEQKADIVDFIMQRRLADIDLSSTDVSDRLITLACGHIFTVETLDGHCNMREFYDIDEIGRFLSTTSPPINYQTPPTCPTCRGPITALRYGRVTKRATLDILEQNVAGVMSRDLDNCSPGITDFHSAMAAAQEQVKKLEFQSNGEKTTQCKPEQTSSAGVHGLGPLPANMLDSDGMQKFHGVCLQEAHAWYKIVKPIVLIYRRILKVATTRGAHVKAYEAALTTLYRLELRAIADDPERATNTPEPLALRIVDQKIGQPPPKADVRFQIEAYFRTLEIRALIAQLAQARVEALPATGEEPDTVHHRGLWTSFVIFLYKSCVTDAEKAMVLATESSAARQAARASVHKIRFEFELFRWDIMTQQSEMVRMLSLDVKARDELSKKVYKYKDIMLRSYDLVQKAYGQGLTSISTLAELNEERKWMDENCRKKVTAWLSECDKLEAFVAKGGLYQPVSTQELEDIVKSFNFSTSDSPLFSPVCLG